MYLIQYTLRIKTIATACNTNTSVLNYNINETIARSYSIVTLSVLGFCTRASYFTRYVYLSHDVASESDINHAIKSINHFGDNCIQNFHLGSCNVGYTVGNLVLRRRVSGAVKRDFRTYIRRYTSQNENFEYGYPHLLRCRIDATTESVMVAYTHKYAKV